MTTVGWLGWSWLGTRHLRHSQRHHQVLLGCMIAGMMCCLGIRNCSSFFATNCSTIFRHDLMFVKTPDCSSERDSANQFGNNVSRYAPFRTRSAFWSLQYAAILCPMGCSSNFTKIPLRTHSLPTCGHLTFLSQTHSLVLKKKGSKFWHSAQWFCPILWWGNLWCTCLVHDLPPHNSLSVHLFWRYNAKISALTINGLLISRLFTFS